MRNNKFKTRQAYSVSIQGIGIQRVYADSKPEARLKAYERYKKVIPDKDKYLVIN